MECLPHTPYLILLLHVRVHGHVCECVRARVRACVRFQIKTQHALPRSILCVQTSEFCHILWLTSVLLNRFWKRMETQEVWTGGSGLDQEPQNDRDQTQLLVCLALLPKLGRDWA